MTYLPNSFYERIPRAQIYASLLFLATCIYIVVASDEYW
jgi:hypothetical protein